MIKKDSQIDTVDLKLEAFPIENLSQLLFFI